MPCFHHGYQALAAAVLRQAVLDLRDPRVSAHVRESARTFLEGAGSLDLWAGLAGLSPEAIASRCPQPRG